MERVKIFTRESSAFDVLESEMNKWFIENEDEVQIVSRHIMGAASTNTVGEGYLNCTIVIFYRPLK